MRIYTDYCMSYVHIKLNSDVSFLDDNSEIAILEPPQQRRHQKVHVSLHKACNHLLLGLVIQYK